MLVAVIANLYLDRLLGGKSNMRVKRPKLSCNLDSRISALQQLSFKRQRIYDCMRGISGTDFILGLLKNCPASRRKVFMHSERSYSFANRPRIIRPPVAICKLIEWLYGSRSVYLPALVLHVRSKQSQRLQSSPKERCRSSKNSRGTIPRMLPPSTLSIRTPAVGGFRWTVRSAGLRHNPHRFSINACSLSTCTTPVLLTQ